MCHISNKSVFVNVFKLRPVKTQTTTINLSDLGISRCPPKSKMFVHKLNGHQQQYIQIFKYICHVGLAGTCLYKKLDRKSLNKAISWKPSMENVGRYNVYLAILLMVSICEIKYELVFIENNKTERILQVRCKVAN
jgi:hypothetical protein